MMVSHPRFPFAVVLVVTPILAGCAAVPLASAISTLPAVALVGAAADDINTSNNVTESSKRPIEIKRNNQTRRFVETNSETILKTLVQTLMSMGFTSVDYDPSSRVGIASGPKYKMSFTFRTHEKNTYLRVSLISITPKNIRFNWAGSANAVQSDASNDEYRDFWNSLGQVAFLRTIQLQPKELF